MSNMWNKKGLKRMIKAHIITLSKMLIAFLRSSLKKESHVRTTLCRIDESPRIKKSLK